MIETKCHNCGSTDLKFEDDRISEEWDGIEDVTNTTEKHQPGSKKKEDGGISRAVTLVAVVIVIAYGMFYLLKNCFEVSQESGTSFLAVGAIIFCIFVVIGIIVYIKKNIKKKTK